MSSSVDLGKLIEYLYRADLYNKVRNTKIINDREDSFIVPILRLALEFNWDVEKAIEFQKYIYDSMLVDNDSLKPEDVTLCEYNPEHLLAEIVAYGVVSNEESFNNAKIKLGLDHISLTFKDLDSLNSKNDIAEDMTDKIIPNSPEP